MQDDFIFVQDYAEQLIIVIIIVFSITDVATIFTIPIIILIEMG